MVKVLLSEEQFLWAIQDWSITENTEGFLRCIYVNGQEFKKAADTCGLNNSRPYKIIQDFDKRLSGKLKNEGLKIRVLFTQ